MGLQLESAFNFDMVGPFKMYINLTAITYATGGPYTHSDYSASVTHAHGATQFSAALQTSIRVFTGDNNYTVTYNATTKAYTIAHPTTAFSMFFIGTPGFFAKRLLGFSDSQGSSTSHTSDVAPRFVLESRFDCPISWSGDYEEEPRRWGGNRNGIIWSGGAPAELKRYDFRIGYIPHTEFWKHEATLSAPWTWEDFINYHAMGEWFFVNAANWYNVNHAHKLHESSANLKPVEADAGFLREYHLDLNTYIFR